MNGSEQLPRLAVGDRPERSDHGRCAGDEETATEAEGAGLQIARGAEGLAGGQDDDRSGVERHPRNLLPRYALIGEEQGRLSRSRLALGVSADVNDVGARGAGLERCEARVARADSVAAIGTADIAQFTLR